MDIRGFIAGVLSLVALIGIIVLQALGKLDVGSAAILSSIASGGMTYALGLYSSPFDAPDKVELVDEPASVVRANDAGWTYVDSVIWIVALTLNAMVLVWIVQVAS